MREPPEHVLVPELLEVLRRHWADDLDAVDFLPVGFGAHHWAASAAGVGRYFVTVDDIGGRRSARGLECAYAAAAELAGAGLEFIVPPVPIRHRPPAAPRYTAPLPSGSVVSCTRLLDAPVAGEGPVVGATVAEVNVRCLTRLHASTPPDRIPVWRTLVEPDFADDLAASRKRAWDGGPFGVRARDAVSRHHVRIGVWTDRYHRLAGRATGNRWVATHGEPHTRNQLTTTAGVVFVDWESLALAPRERDLRTLIDAGYASAVAPDWAMVEMFDLEWRLDEIAQYAAWFRGPHGDSADDRIAFEGLLHELQRPEWTGPVD